MPTITLDPGTLEQKLLGWQGLYGEGTYEASAAGWAAARDGVVDLLTYLGLNRLHFPLYVRMQNTTDYWDQYKNGVINLTQFYAVRNTWGGAGAPIQFSVLDDWVNDFVLPMRNAVEALGDDFRFSVQFVDFGPTGTRMIEVPSAYTAFIVACFKRFRDVHGLTPVAFDVINEPDANSVPFTGTEIGQALAVLVPALAAEGFTPHFVAPSVANIDNATTRYADIKAESTAVTDLSVHKYGGTISTGRTNVWNAASADGIRTQMNEHIGDDYNELYLDVVNMHTSVWMQFALTYFTNNDPAEGTGAYVVFTDNAGAPNVRVTTRAKMFSQYFRWLRYGAQRIGASTDNGSFLPVAAVNRDGRMVCVVKCSTTGSITVTGLPVGLYGITYATSSVWDTNLSDQAVLTAGGSVTFTMPASGVVTVYAKHQGVVGGDTVGIATTGMNFASASIGTHKLVTAGGLSLTGADASNYALAINAVEGDAHILTDTFLPMFGQHRRRHTSHILRR